MSAPRLQDWPLRFAAYHAARLRLPFAWGSTDCAQTARQLITALTGEDPAAAWGLAPYRTALGARRVLDRLGGLPSLPRLAECREIPLLFAGRGDLVLHPNEGRAALGYVVDHRAAFAGKHKLELMPLADCSAAWRVGGAV